MSDQPITDSCIAFALERLATEAERDTDTADPLERKFFRRWAGAYRKSLFNFLQGTRPVAAPSGGWLIASATRSAVHQVAADGYCSCEAQGQGCWHAALALGMEIGTQAAQDPFEIAMHATVAHQ